MIIAPIATTALDKIRAEAARAAINFRAPSPYEASNPAALHYINECAQTIKEAREALVECHPDATEYAERQMRYIRRALEARQEVMHRVSCGQYWRTPPPTPSPDADAGRR